MGVRLKGRRHVLIGVVSLKDLTSLSDNEQNRAVEEYKQCQRNEERQKNYANAVRQLRGCARPKVELEADTINNSRNPKAWHVVCHSLNPWKCSKCHDQPTFHLCFMQNWMDYEEISICGYQNKIYT